MKMGKCEKEVADWFVFIREWLEKTIDFLKVTFFAMCLVRTSFWDVESYLIMFNITMISSPSVSASMCF